jgi:hypothetical protein
VNKRLLRRLIDLSLSLQGKFLAVKCPGISGPQGKCVVKCLPGFTVYLSIKEDEAEIVPAVKVGRVDRKGTPE